MSSLVKVIVPCYGYAELLEGCVTSVLEQGAWTSASWSSTTAPPTARRRWAAELSAADERVEVRRHSTQSGSDRDRQRGSRVGGRQRLRRPALCRRPAGAGCARPGGRGDGGKPRGRPGLRTRSVLRDRCLAAAAGTPLARDDRALGRQVDRPALPQRPQLHLLARGGRAHLGAAARRRLRPRLSPHQRPATCGCGSLPSPTSPTSGARRRRSTGSTPTACCAACWAIATARSSTCASAGPPSSAFSLCRRAPGPAPLAPLGRTGAGPPGALAGQPRLRPGRGRGPGRRSGRGADRFRARDLPGSAPPARVARPAPAQRIGAGARSLPPFLAPAPPSPTGAAHRLRGGIYGRLRCKRDAAVVRMMSVPAPSAAPSARGRAAARAASVEGGSAADRQVPGALDLPSGERHAAHPAAGPLRRPRQHRSGRGSAVRLEDSRRSSTRATATSR